MFQPTNAPGVPSADLLRLDSSLAGKLLVEPRPPDSFVARRPIRFPGPGSVLARRPGRSRSRAVELGPEGLRPGARQRGCRSSTLQSSGPVAGGQAYFRTRSAGGRNLFVARRTAPAAGEPAGPLGQATRCVSEEMHRIRLCDRRRRLGTDPKARDSSEVPDRDRSRGPSCRAHNSVALLRGEQAPFGDGAEPLRKPPTRSGLRRGPGRRTSTTSYRQRTRLRYLGWRKQAPVGSGAGPLEAAGHKDRPRRRRSP
jgi:hypothetical protein